MAAAEGHPSAVMDMSFANQALSLEYLMANANTTENGVYVVPRDIDDEVGRLKLAALGVSIDTLSEEQEKSINSWEEGT